MDSERNALKRLENRVGLDSAASAGSPLIDDMATMLREFFAAKDEYMSEKPVTCLRMGEAQTKLKTLLARYDAGER